MQDKRLDPSHNDNYALFLANNDHFVDIVKLLLKDERVRNSLSDMDKIEYKELLKEI